MEMEVFSQARKTKLLALRKRKAEENAGIEPTDQLAIAVKRNFRNYDPITGQVRRFQGPKALKHTVENQVNGVQESVIQDEERRRAQELDLTNIAPKRPNWDLKRDMEKRLQKLQRRDKEAILILIRQRIQAQQKACGVSATDTSNQAGVTALSAKMAATATANADLSDQSSDSD